MSDSMWRKYGKILSNRYGMKCHYCGHKLITCSEMNFIYDNYPYYEFNKRTGGAKAATVDHKVPKSKGGNDDLDNLVVACFDCNNKKRELYSYDEFKRLMSNE